MANLFGTFTCIQKLIRRLFVICWSARQPAVGRGATAPEQTTNSLAFDGDGMRRHRIDHQGNVRGWRMFDRVRMASKMSATTPRERHFGRDLTISYREDSLKMSFWPNPITINPIKRTCLGGLWFPVRQCKSPYKTTLVSSPPDPWHEDP